jgi:hypothetical protein
MKKFIFLSIVFLIATTMFAQEKQNALPQKQQQFQKNVPPPHHGMRTLEIYGSHDPLFSAPRRERSRILDFRAMEEKDIDHFRLLIQEKVIYPPVAIQKELQGVVYVEFTVTEGKIMPLTIKNILKGVDPLLDNEVIRVINLNLIWAPLGKMHGTKTYSIPVQFILK